MMKEIERNNQDILAIVKVISEIESKTKVINDIVFQTKLLSFNASVEAARAGEQGKGFAVVAEEVGNLAQMSGNSAKEIALLLEESTKKVELIVSNTKSKVDRLVVNSNEKIEQGSEIAKECGVILNAIVDNVESVNGVVNEISTASIEQDRGIKEISKAVNQLDQSTQQNSTATQQTANAAQQLSHQAEILRSTVLELLGTVNGIQ
jgi:methyl-accepting chemotaxis protein